MGLLAAPLARAQGLHASPVVGFLSSRSPAATPHQVAGFRLGLAEEGFVEGKNVSIEFRWAEGAYDRLPALAGDLVARRVDVIATAGGSPSALAAKAATSSIPIVFNSGGDLVRLGLVNSFGRPTGNLTGISQFALLLGPKRLELLSELIPKAGPIAMLANPNNPNKNERSQMEEASRRLGLKLTAFAAGSANELDAALIAIASQRFDGLIVTADAFLDDRRNQVIAIVERLRIPAIYPWPEYVREGGLMSYAFDVADGYRQAGIYVGKILKGTKPKDLPVLQPARLQLVVNRKTAKTLGIEIPQSILLRADEIIE